MSTKSVSKSALKQLTELDAETSIREVEDRHNRHEKRTSTISASQDHSKPAITRPKQAKRKKKAVKRKAKSSSIALSVATDFLYFPNVSNGPQSPELPKPIVIGSAGLLQPLTSYPEYLNAKMSSELKTSSIQSAGKSTKIHTKSPFSGQQKSYSSWLENGRKPYSNKGPDKGLNLLDRKLVAIYSRPQRLVAYQPTSHSKKSSRSHLVSLDGRPGTPIFVDRSVDHTKGLASSLCTHGLGTPTPEGTAKVEALIRSVSNDGLLLTDRNPNETLLPLQNDEYNSNVGKKEEQTVDASLLISQPNNVDAPKAQSKSSNQDDEEEEKEEKQENLGDTSTKKIDVGGEKEHEEPAPVNLNTNPANRASNVEKSSHASTESYGSDAEDFDDDDFEDDEDENYGQEEEQEEKEGQEEKEEGEEDKLAALNSAGIAHASENKLRGGETKSKIKNKKRTRRAKKAPRIWRLLNTESAAQRALKLKYKAVTREQADFAAQCCKERIIELRRIDVQKQEEHVSGLVFRE